MLWFSNAMAAAAAYIRQDEKKMVHKGKVVVSCDKNIPAIQSIVPKPCSAERIRPTAVGRKHQHDIIFCNLAV